MEEKRKHRRYEAAYPLECMENIPGREEVSAMVDLSENGVAFSCYRPFPAGEELSLNVYFKRRMFRLKARAVYSIRQENGNYRIGALLVNPPDEFKRVFKREIEETEELQKESNKYFSKDLTFKDASLEYLRSGLSQEFSA